MMSVYCLKYAESILPESMVFDGGSREKKIPIAFAVYCICVGNQKILVDAGCDTMPGFVMKDFVSPVSVLGQIGLSPEEITDVIITHGHHDHIACIKHFENAVIHITEEALPGAKKYIPEGRRINCLGADFEIAKNVTVLKIGGHAKGSAIVEIRTDKTIHILAGDECYTDENITRKLCTGSFVNQEKAKAFIEKYSDPRYCVHTCHSISLKTERIL